MALSFPFQPKDLILIFAALSISGSTLNVEFVQLRQGHCPFSVSQDLHLTTCTMSSNQQARTAATLSGTQEKVMDQVATPWSPHNPDVDAKVFPGHKQQQGPVQSRSVQLPRALLGVCGDWHGGVFLRSLPPAVQQQAHIHPESTCWAMCICHQSFHQQTRQLGFGYENATSGCVGWDPQKDRLTSPANSCKDFNEVPCLKKKKVNSESRILDARVMDMH